MTNDEALAFLARHNLTMSYSPFDDHRGYFKVTLRTGSPMTDLSAYGPTLPEVIYELVSHLRSREFRSPQYSHIHLSPKLSYQVKKIVEDWEAKTDET